MTHSDFSIGTEFYTGAAKWRCTDVGTRTIVAIRIDQVTVVHSDGKGRTTSEIVSNDESWFNGPPYAVAESVFDEYSFAGCSLGSDPFSTEI
jgi:hypothetical protein